MAKVVMTRLFSIHRYKVHPKLVSFMAPVGGGKMSDIARYRSAIASTNNLYVSFLSRNDLFTVWLALLLLSPNNYIL